MKIYRYPRENVFAIDNGSEIYNIFTDSKIAKYSKGVIIKGNEIKDSPIKFPYDILLETKDTYEIANNEKYIYDKNVWELMNDKFEYIEDRAYKIDLNDLKIVEPENKLINKEIIRIIKDIIKNVDIVKGLYKEDDYVLKRQWFMEYVDFTSFNNNENDTREKQIYTCINNIKNYFKDLQINNNYQIKLLFEIFFNSTDNCISNTTN